MSAVSLLVTGIAIGAVGLILKVTLKKYEFENRTGANVVQFKSFWGSNFHKFKHWLSRILMFVGMGFIVFSGITSSLDKPKNPEPNKQQIDLEKKK